MINRDAGPIVKFCIYVSLALFLCIAPSCTKAPEQPAAKTSTPPASEPGIPPTAPEKPADPGAPAVADQQKAAINDSPLVPIAIKLPKPLFIGTPQNIVLENLEKPLGKPRPPFLAPAGTSNVALGKRIASSDNSPIIGELECITDGNKDSSDGNYVQLGPGVQHITIDLGTRCEIYAIVVWHLHKQPVVFFDVIVQSADDANFIENANTLFNNDIDNSAGMGIGKNMHYTETNEGKLIDARGIKARYVRLYSNGYSLEESNYYTEVEVYGRTIK